MEIKIITEPIAVSELAPLAEAWYKELIKGVADLEQKIIALGGEWHMDANMVLIAEGSAQSNVWGFNIYPGRKGEEAIEYNSLINIRPALGMKTNEIQDKELRAKIRAVVARLIPELEL